MTVESHKVSKKYVKPDEMIYLVVGDKEANEWIEIARLWRSNSSRFKWRFSR